MIAGRPPCSLSDACKAVLPRLVHIDEEEPIKHQTFCSWSGIGVTRWLVRGTGSEVNPEEVFV